MERNEVLEQAASTVVGAVQANLFSKLLRAAESKNTLAEVIETAIRSKIKSETERLEGKVLRRMETLGTDAKTRDKVKFALGIGGRRNEQSDILSELGGE